MANYYNSQSGFAEIEAKICLDCPTPDEECTGECEYFKTELVRLKTEFKAYLKKHGDEQCAKKKRPK